MPIPPPSASISRTMCPLAIPPIAGLQDILAVSSSFTVSSAVESPSRAHATAASHPACPAPTTTTSNDSLTRVSLLAPRAAMRDVTGRRAARGSFPDAEAAEDAVEQILSDRPPGDLTDRGQRFAQLQRHDLAGSARRARGAGTAEPVPRALQSVHVAGNSVPPPRRIPPPLVPVLPAPR